MGAVVKIAKSVVKSVKGDSGDNGAADAQRKAEAKQVAVEKANTAKVQKKKQDDLNSAKKSAVFEATRKKESGAFLGASSTRDEKLGKNSKLGE